MSAAVLRCIAAWFCLVATAAVSQGDTIAWSVSDGQYSSPGNWTNTSGGVVGPPGTDDVALFDQNDPSQFVFVTPGDEAGAISVTDGEVNLITGSPFSDTTFDMSSGASTIDVSGGTLNLGRVGDGVLFFNLPNAVTGFGNNASLLTVGSFADGILRVEGANSRLDVRGALSHNIGFGGGEGALVIQQGATANIGNPAIGGGSLNVGDSNTGTTSGDVLVLGGGTLNTGAFDIAPRTSAATGDVLLSGPGSSISQTTAGATLTVGSPSGGAGTLEIADSAVFNTNTGDVTIGATGTVSITAGGVFNANGSVTVDGGTLSGASGDLNLANGRSLTASNGASVQSNNDFVFNNDATLSVLSGSQFGSSADFNTITAGSGSMGSITIDGPGTFGRSNQWDIGKGGGSGVATISGGAEFRLFKFGGGQVGVANDPATASQGQVNVLSGGDFRPDNLNIATLATTGTMGTVVVDGVCSQVRSFTTRVGSTTFGTARLSLQNGGALAGGGFGNFPNLTVDPTGLVEVGVAGAGAIDLAGHVLVSGGTLRLGSGATVSVSDTADSGAHIDVAEGGCSRRQMVGPSSRLSATTSATAGSSPRQET